MIFPFDQLELEILMYTDYLLVSDHMLEGQRSQVEFPHGVTPASR